MSDFRKTKWLFFQIDVTSCSMRVFQYFLMFWKLQMFCFRFFKLSYFADVDLSVSNPTWVPTLDSRWLFVIDSDLLPMFDHNPDLQEDTRRVTIVFMNNIQTYRFSFRCDGFVYKDHRQWLPVALDLRCIPMSANQDLERPTIDGSPSHTKKRF